jgi:hypothetical protein
MDKLILIISISVIILCLYMFIENKLNDLEYVKSDVDNKMYLVQRHKDSKKAANLIANIKERLVKLCNYCYENDSDNEAIKRLKEKFNQDVIVEVGKNSKYTSYSVNKGEKIVLCLRSRDGSNNIIDENTLMFVSTHELAHIMTKSIGHTDEFWDNFRYLLNKAIKLNLYKKIDYTKNPKKYCGMTITSSPLF